MNRVDHRLEQQVMGRRAAEACTDHHAIIVRAGELGDEYSFGATVEGEHAQIDMITRVDELLLGDRLVQP